MTKIDEQDTKPSMIQPDTVSLEKLVVLKGDFAQGERTLPPVADVPDFARGERTLPTPAVAEDFASGEHELPVEIAAGDFASGEHTPAAVPPTPIALDHKE